jgi:hypothetical protein
MNLLEKFAKYYHNTPSFHYVKQRFFAKTPLVFDHVAHRSFGYVPILSYYSSLGFKQQKDLYHFPHMGVRAIWLKHSSFRVFLSQYEEPMFQQIRSYDDFRRIQAQNDYVAWTLLHKDDINHVAIQVDNLDEILEKIKRDGHLQLNRPHQPIEESEDGKLRQASTIADKIPYRFANGETKEVPYAFVEFIERRDGRDGFETRNAANIFTSTNIK